MPKTRSRRRASPQPPALRLRLYVAGNAPNSLLARATLRELLAQSANGPAELEIVDVFERADLALQDQVYVTPMLVRLSPLPRCRVIGNLSDRSAVLHLLEGRTDGAER